MNEIIMTDHDGQSTVVLVLESLRSENEKLFDRNEFIILCCDHMACRERFFPRRFSSNCYRLEFGTSATFPSYRRYCREFHFRAILHSQSRGVRVSVKFFVVLHVQCRKRRLLCRLIDLTVDLATRTCDVTMVEDDERDR